LGIATQLYQIAKNYSASAGALQTQIGRLQVRDGEQQNRVNDIQAAAAAYRARLQAQFANYQAAITRANNTMTYLRALLDASSR
jgi:flagellar hook-associated protein 2